MTSSTAGRQKVIDIHTHMYSQSWRDVAQGSKNGLLRFNSEDNMMYFRGLMIGRLEAPMLDYEARIRAMDEAGVDVAVLSLPGPNVYWGTPAENIAAARAINDAFAAAQRDYAGRIRWMASLPLQDEAASLEELKRAKAAGAVGVCVLTNILGTALTDPAYSRIWSEVQAMELPVFIHPMTPFSDAPELRDYSFSNTIGFISDTTLCFARMIHSGFFDQFPRLKTIACHGGGTLPYLIGRFDRMWNVSPNAGATIKQPPRSYLKNIYFDSVVYDEPTLRYLVEQVGSDRVMYGSDYPFRLGDMRGVLQRVDRLDPETAARIRGGNAAALFQI